MIVNLINWLKGLFGKEDKERKEIFRKQTILNALSQLRYEMEKEEEIAKQNLEGWMKANTQSTYLLRFAKKHLEVVRHQLIIINQDIEEVENGSYNIDAYYHNVLERRQEMWFKARDTYRVPAYIPLAELK